MTPFRPFLALVAILSFGAPALAQDLPDLGEARDLIFSEDGATEVAILPQSFLDEADIAVLSQLSQMQRYPYYAAMAVAPGMSILEAAQTNSMALSGNYHDEENARRAALAACEDVRSGGSPCQVVMIVRPRGWQPGRPLQLSAEAAAALNTEYRRLPRRSRAMAISTDTGLWGIGESREAAIAACGAADCEVVIEG